jgi:type II secretory ATPase GspE/PulE/Tfp pilus assembly ATPase PilB-like protein
MVVSVEVRQMLCFTESGRLYIDEKFKHDPKVRAFRQRLSRSNKGFVERLVKPGQIPIIYERFDNASAVERTDTQKQAQKLFEAAVAQRTSDIHIRVWPSLGTKILFRVHNDLIQIEEHSYEYGDRLCSTIYQALADVSDSAFNKSERQDGRIADATKLADGLDGIRIATTPQAEQDSYLMVLRLLYNDAAKSLDLSTLGFDPFQIKSMDIARRRPTGINIIAGPTGSGKSTTLQRTLGLIHHETKGRKHLITVEDPPEYPIPGAIQTPVTNADTEEERRVAFQKAIKASLRLDPDILMIGEMRDSVSASLAIEAAMTGHQVWTTVHANNALAIFSRLLSLNISLDMVTDSSIISSLTCQRLIKKLCPHCKIPLHTRINSLDPGAGSRVMSVVKDINTVYLRNDDGCDQCNHTGVAGRTVVVETMVTDQTLMDYIRKKDNLGALRHWKERQGGITMLEHAITKIAKGEADPFDVESTVGELTLSTFEADHMISNEEINSVEVSSSDATLDDYFAKPDFVHADAEHAPDATSGNIIDDNAVVLSDEDLADAELFFQDQMNS